MAESVNDQSFDSKRLVVCSDFRFCKMDANVNDQSFGSKRLVVCSESVLSPVATGKAFLKAAKKLYSKKTVQHEGAFEVLKKVFKKLGKKFE